MKKSILFLSCITLALSLSLSNFIYAAELTANNREELKKIINDAWNKREKTIYVNYNEDFNSIYENFDSVLVEITNIDDKTTSDDSDYLYGLLSEYEISQLDGILQMNFDYYETLEQTAQVNKEISTILSKLNLSGLSEYEKVKAVHNYIIETINYNNASENDSVYEALLSGSASYNGYTLLAYKMLTELGIDCKYITGTVYEDVDSKEEHAWNIVKVDGNWYNIDITWDDSDEEDTIDYDYFLKGSQSFNKDHILDAEFNTPEFQSKYPISVSNYNQKETNYPADLPTKPDPDLDDDFSSTIEEETLGIDLNQITVDKQITLKRGKNKTVHCYYPEGTNKDNISLIYYKSTNKKIAAVDKEGKITGQKKGKCVIITYIILTDGTNKEYQTKIKVKK